MVGRYQRMVSDKKNFLCIGENNPHLPPPPPHPRPPTPTTTTIPGGYAIDESSRLKTILVGVTKGPFLPNIEIGQVVSDKEIFKVFCLDI